VTAAEQARALGILDDFYAVALRYAMAETARREQAQLKLCEMVDTKNGGKRAGSGRPRIHPPKAPKSLADKGVCGVKLGRAGECLPHSTSPRHVTPDREEPTMPFARHYIDSPPSGKPEQTGGVD
jgi:hypothetical protein